MKLDFALLAIFSSHTVEPCLKYEHCFLKELDENKTAHFQKWDCSEIISQGWVFYVNFNLCEQYLIDSSWSAVPYGTKCALVCEENYIPVAPTFRKLHQCGMNGWEDPDKFDMVCEYSGE